MTVALQKTDECNVEYEVQLNCKHEKMTQQLRHLQALEQNIVQLNQQLESNASKGISAAGAVGVLRQNVNYRSLPLGAKPQSLIDHTSQQNNQRANTHHSKDTLLTQKFDILTCEDNANSRKDIDATSQNLPVGNSINLSVTAVSEVNSSCSLPPVNSVQWNHQAVVNADVSHSENLRNTSYRMIDQFALRQADVHQSKQSVDTCLPVNVDHNTDLSSFGQRSAGITDNFPVTAESVHVKLPLTVNEPPELEQTLQSKDVSLSPHSKVQEVGSVVSDISSQPRRPTDGRSELVLLPDVIGSTGAASSLSVSSASKVPPPVAQKSKFRYPCLSGYDVRSCDSAALSTQPTVIATDFVDTVENNPQNTSTSDSLLPYDTRITVRQDLALEKLELKNMSGELQLGKSGDLSQRESFSDDDGQDSTDSSRLVDRPVYKPSVTYPVRRRLSMREEPQFSSTCTSGDVQGKAGIDSAAEDSPVSSEGNISKVQTVKNKLRADRSRRVQFEPLALLLDAALEGEIDLLQTTLKV